MDQAELPLTLRCPEHRAYVIGMLNGETDAKKIGYCFKCIEESDKDGVVIKARKSVSSYLEDCSSFYEKCRQKVPTADEFSAEYIEELSRRRERIENASQHIGQEKNKVQRSFAEIRRIVDQIINEKENECLDLLEKEILSLEEAYRYYEKLLMMAGAQLPDNENIYPEIDILNQRMSQIDSVGQLRAFMTGIQEDIEIQNSYFVDEDGKYNLKKKLNGLIRCFNMPESSLPNIQGSIFNSENLENLMKDLMKGFCQQEVQVENSIASRINALSYQSSIIVPEQFVVLRDWLPKGYKFDLKLLFRGSVDGMSHGKFHEKCDGQGATITLIKCQFNGAPSSSTLGGFIDQSWHSNGNSSNSKEAFLFSLAEQSCQSVKCPILEPQFGNAFYGHPQYGPTFGSGCDLFIHNGFATGISTPSGYSNSVALQNGYGKEFKVMEIEVYQVL